MMPTMLTMLTVLLLACTSPDDKTFAGGSDGGADSASGDDAGGAPGGDTTDDTTDDTGLLDGPYSALCLHDLPSPILDATGTFSIADVEGVPEPLPVGAAVDNTGGLEIVACAPNRQDENPILDDMVFSVHLSLFDHDDAPMDLGIGDDASGVNVLTGGATDWNDVVDWDEDGTFMSFEAGVGSFSEIDKDGGRLVGVIDVTETDPPGYEMQVTIDLTW